MKEQAEQAIAMETLSNTTHNIISFTSKALGVTEQTPSFLCYREEKLQLDTKWEVNTLQITAF